MLVDPQSNLQNRRLAIGVTIGCVLVLIILIYFSWYWVLAVPLSAGVYHLIRRRTARRVRVIGAPFPSSWEVILNQDVAFFRALRDERKPRFRNMVKVFCDEVPITGIRTEIDERTRVLVAASAVIPVFGFDDWEYSGLGEVLVYPGPFDDGYCTGQGDENILGMVGTGHLSGVMILSKPDLISGFTNPEDKRNVGIHEFAHLVDKADGAVDGLPLGIDKQTALPWVQWVGEELKSEGDGKNHINDYAYTNEAEYFAVLSEYFFEAPDVLAKKNPELYAMMESMYRQNTRKLLSGVRAKKPKRVGRNSPCPCGSGKKYKKCCRRKSVKGFVG